jgi:hypothetical protein
VVEIAARAERAATAAIDAECASLAAGLARSLESTGEEWEEAYDDDFVDAEAPIEVLESSC